MNKLILVVAFTLISSTAFAKNSCIEKLKEAANKCAIKLGASIERKHDKAICKNVNFRGVTEGGNYQEIKNTVAMLDNKAISIINHLKEGCQLSYITVTDNAAELLSIDGRAYIRSEKGRIFVVGRNGIVSEMMNAEGKEYRNLIDIKGNDVGGITLQLERNRKVELNNVQLFNRLNDPSKKVLLGF